MYAMKEEDRRRVIQHKLARMSSEPAGALVSTGFAALDAALGVGGLPRGVIVEIFGPPDSGKTTLILQIAARAQRSGLRAAWVDTECTFDPRYAAALGVAVEELTVVRPDSAEQALTMLHHLARSCALGLIVVDSAAALVPALELEADIGDQSPGLQSRVIAAGLRTLSHVVANAAITVVFLNQAWTRQTGFGENWETSAGGPALKLHSSIRIALNQVTETRVSFRILKNKAAAAFGTGELTRGAGLGFVESP